MKAVLVALATLLAAPAQGETVFVDASFGEVGNGWLFGSRSDQSCWVALPWHVVATMEADSAPPFFFTDPRGQVGEAAAPIRVSHDDAALAATGGNDDLAFARVTAGVATQGCTSRLGLPGAGFALALGAAARLHFSAMQEGTTIGFAAELLRAVADADRGSTFLVRPANDSDRAFLQGGLSGGIVMMEWEGHLHPAGMVLGVLEDQKGAVALRFDKLRLAFEAIEASTRPQEPPDAAKPAGTVAIEVVGARGSIAENSSPLTTIVAAGGCWRAAPAAGERAVEIILKVSGLETGLKTGGGHSLQLVADPMCGPPQGYVVELREATGGWTTISGSCLSGPAASPACRLPPRQEMELRLRAAPRQQGWLGLSRIIIR